MKVISQKELDKEFEYLEKQKAILKEEREKIMLERSKLYYQWKEIQETDESIQKDQERVNKLRGDLQFELKKVNEEYTIKIDAEIAEIRKEKNNELELELQQDRLRLDKIRRDLHELIAIEEATVITFKQKNII